MTDAAETLVHQPHDWLRHHIALMCGSYVSFVTAFLVVQPGRALAMGSSHAGGDPAEHTW